MKRFSELLQRARIILQTEGFTSLMERGLTFVIPVLFESGAYHLYEHPIGVLDETRFLPKVKDVTVRIVSSNKEADALAVEGFDFRSRFVNARRMLDKGAIAACIFVGREIAHIGWLGMRKVAKNTFDSMPYEVDFLNKEACTGGDATLKEYRGLGLMTYSIFKRYEFLRNTGVLVTRHAIAVNNVGSKRAYGKFNHRIYAKARYLKVLCWRFWREAQLA